VAFAAMSVACALAPDIGALIAFRFLQGAAGAAGVVLSLAMVRDLYEGTELARILGSLTLVFGLAGAGARHRLSGAAVHQLARRVRRAGRHRAGAAGR